MDLDSKVETYTIHSDFNSYDKLINPMMMDRNLGALSATCWPTSNDNSAQGMRYQWGRKDPFPERDNSAMASTTFMTTYDKENNMISSFAGFVEGNNSSWSYIGTPIELMDIAKYPMRYIGSGAENWLKDGGNDLWGNPALTSKDAPTNDTGHKTIYDPCPPGYRVPHAYVWTGFVSVPEGGRYSTGAVNVNLASGTMTEVITNGGGTFSVGSTPTYPNTGYLNNASSGPVIKNPANRGQSWKQWCNNLQKMASSLMYDTANFFPLRSQAKTYGYPVRCMKDTK